jgi:hypothetical protein
MPNRRDDFLVLMVAHLNDLKRQQLNLVPLDVNRTPGTIQANRPLA